MSSLGKDWPGLQLGDGQADSLIEVPRPLGALADRALESSLLSL